MGSGLFKKDFTLVVIGQIISLFGNAAIRFAMPLYLLNETGSSALFGTVTACAFIPAILLSPVDGIIADRVNKRNIMVILDFLTSIVILIFSLLLGRVELIVLVAVTMMFLYGIAGAYQPSVQASIPALVSQDNIMAANSVINTINSFSSLTGPVIGGILYSAYGLKPVLYVCIACFFVSAVMEIFIKIPFKKQAQDGSILHIAKEDLLRGLDFIRKDQPVIGKVLIITCGLNLFLAAMIVTGMPYIITEVLMPGSLQANKLCGYAEGALAAGGLAGGIFAGVFAGKLSVKKAGMLLTGCALSIFPVSIALVLPFPGITSYIIMAVCFFIIMVLSTIFTIQMLSFVQSVTPQDLTGKVMAVILSGSMCSQPLGNALYGIFFEICKGYEFAVILFAGVTSLIVAISSKNIFKKYDVE